MHAERRGLQVAVWVAALLVLLSLGLAACGSDDEPAATPARTTPSPVPQATGADQPSGDVGAETSRGPQVQGTPVTIVNQDPGGSGKYRFSPADLSFKVGDQVAFTLTAESEFHTFTVEALDIDESLDKGEVVNFSHVMSKAGEFKLICLIHEGQGMVGTITVTP